ncbi:MAG: DUF4445 domain-containing protein [Thermoanaerobacteraceae bacterium]|nr:DUF4445 domain-containing protein [Thermoanaerobacteraceae bacterium]
MKGTTVTFLPDNITIHVPKGTSLLEAAREAGLLVEAHCGGKGNCGKCRVLVEGLISEDITSTERQALHGEEINAGWRLACQVKVEDTPLTVRIPAPNRPYLVKAALSGGVKPAVKPFVHKISSFLPPASLEEPSGSWERLQRNLAGSGYRVKPGMTALLALPDALRDNGGQVTAVIYGDYVIAVQRGDTTAEDYGLALDIGTTTVAGSLIDLRTGRELAVVADLNKQSRYGADVISRIDFAAASPGGLEKMTTLAREVVNGIIGDLCQKTGVKPDAIHAATVVGNTCMLHLFAGLNPRTLAVPPFVGTIHQSFVAGAEELGMDIAPWAPVMFLPVISGYVGADTVGAILATGVQESEKITLLIDIGTNGEIVLGSRDRLLACSAAAGPAFEGANISAGMRAAEGAIDRVAFSNDQVICSVIGGGKPRGICGSGLIDAVAGMLGVGLVDASGRLLERQEAAATVGPHLAARIRETQNGREFLLAGEIAITQQDIRQVQLAKGAIQAGIRILQKKLAIGDGDIEEVLLAGSFGNYINKTAAMRLGLIPPIPLERVKCVGNAAHQGAKMVLLNEEVVEKAGAVSRLVEYVELSACIDFAAEFTQAMDFVPHPAGEN